MGDRPQFAQARTAFQNVYGDGSLHHVGRFVGGKVRTNIDSGVFENACAIRMSYVLNSIGIPIVAGSTDAVSGSDGRRYIFRVKDLFSFLQTRLGKPDLVVSHPSAAALQGRKGIIVFEVSGWTNASGHATLWDGTQCPDRCYFVQAHRVNFWELR